LESGLPLDRFPVLPPFTVDEVESDGTLPDRTGA